MVGEFEAEFFNVHGLNLESKKRYVVHSLHVYLNYNIF